MQICFFHISRGLNFKHNKDFLTKTLKPNKDGNNGSGDGDDDIYINMNSMASLIFSKTI